MFSVFRSLSKYSLKKVLLVMQIDVPLNCVKRSYYNNENLKKIFCKSLEVVNTRKLIRDNVKIEGKNILICKQTYSLETNKIYLVGFGKAVFNMATELEGILGDKLIKGIVSVPVGTPVTEYNKQMAGKGKITFYEGAKDNQPDLRSIIAAEQIFNFVTNLQKSDLLIVLISGGGSALLPYPILPVSLTEKGELIKKLSKNGATIVEMNTVRKRLSQVKGGGLARKAFPAYVVSLILSDIIGDPIDMIASGPTLPNKDPPEAAMEIVKKYGLGGEISKGVKQVLEKPIDDAGIPMNPLGNYFHVENHIIGNNILMINAAKEDAISKGYSTMVVSTGIEGDVNALAQTYAELAADVGECILGISSKAYLRLKYEEETLLGLRDSIKDLLKLDFENEAGVCILGAGEPTVHVLGKGKGGRNQHLALQFSMAMNGLMVKSPNLEKVTVSFLSCGSDGFDGPTDAAGAIGSSLVCRIATKYNLDPSRFIRNSDSYSFYSEFMNGEYMVKTGLTGTNVMDLHCIVVTRMSPRDDFVKGRSQASRINAYGRFRSVVGSSGSQNHHKSISQVPEGVFP